MRHVISLSGWLETRCRRFSLDTTRRQRPHARSIVRVSVEKVEEGTQPACAAPVVRARSPSVSKAPTVVDQWREMSNSSLMERRPQPQPYSAAAASPSRREHEAAHPTTHPSRAACSVRSLRGFFNGKFLLAVVVFYTCSHLIHVEVITDEKGDGNDATAYPAVGPVTRPSQSNTPRASTRTFAPRARAATHGKHP